MSELDQWALLMREIGRMTHWDDAETISCEHFGIGLYELDNEQLEDLLIMLRIEEEEQWFWEYECPPETILRA